MIDWSELADSGFKYGGGVSLLLIVANLLWGLTSKTRREGVRDRTDGQKARAEVDFITALQTEIKLLRDENSLLRDENRLVRERADLAFKERNEALQEAAQLRVAITTSARDITDLQMALDLLQDKVKSIDLKKSDE